MGSRKEAIISLVLAVILNAILWTSFNPSSGWLKENAGILFTIVILVIGIISLIISMVSIVHMLREKGGDEGKLLTVIMIILSILLDLWVLGALLLFWAMENSPPSFGWS